MSNLFDFILYTVHKQRSNGSHSFVWYHLYFLMAWFSCSLSASVIFSHRDFFHMQASPIEALQVAVNKFFFD